MARDSADVIDFVRISLAAVEGFGALEWVLVAIVAVLLGPMIAQIAEMAWKCGKRFIGRSLSYLWREFLDWLAERVFAWMMAALIALGTLWSSGFWGWR